MRCEEHEGFVVNYESGLCPVCEMQNIIYQLSHENEQLKRMASDDC
jgi:hypothetical protein